MEIISICGQQFLLSAVSKEGIQRLGTHYNESDGLYNYDYSELLLDDGRVLTHKEGWYDNADGSRTVIDTIYLR